MARPSRTHINHPKPTPPAEPVVPKQAVRKKDVEAASALTQARRQLAKQAYLDYGPARSLVRAKPEIVAKIGDVSDRTLEKWCSEDEWVDAALKWDQDFAGREVANLRELIALGQLDRESALELVMAKALDLLLRSNFAIASPQDARAIMTLVKQAQDTIEVLRDPERSTQQRIQGATATTGDAEVTVKLRGSRAIAALSAVEEALRGNIPTRAAPVIDVKAEAVVNDVSRETKPPVDVPEKPPAQQALLPAPAKPVAVDIHELGAIAAKTGKTFAQILSERTAQR